jgi:hypothetical protein
MSSEEEEERLTEEEESLTSAENEITEDDIHGYPDIVYYASHVHGVFLRTCASIINNDNCKYLSYEEIGRLVLKTIEDATDKLIEDRDNDKELNDRELNDRELNDKEFNNVIKYLTNNIVYIVQNVLDNYCKELKNKERIDNLYIGPEIYCLSSIPDTWNDINSLEEYGLHAQQYSSGNIRFRLNPPDNYKLCKDSIIKISVFLYKKEYDKMKIIMENNFDMSDYKPINVKDVIEKIMIKR